MHLIIVRRAGVVDIFDIFIYRMHLIMVHGCRNLGLRAFHGSCALFNLCAIVCVSDVVVLSSAALLRRALRRLLCTSLLCGAHSLLVCKTQYLKTNENTDSMR